MNILFGVLVFAFHLHGCSSLLVEPQASTYQKKVTNTEHWQLIANAKVIEIIRAAQNIPQLDVRVHVLDGEGTLPTSLIGRRYFTQESAMDMPFSVTYKRMLEKSLLDSGWSLFLLSPPIETGPLKPEMMPVWLVNVSS